MDLIYTNQNREDIGVLQDFSLDLAFGSGENDFELTVSRENNVAQAGCYIYIQGTEYGGIIDAVKSDTGTAEVTYSGRTWHGILNSKILEPDSGQAYLTVSGDANTVLSTLIARMGLGALFQALSTPSGITVKSYQFDRYVSGYNGILKMLKTVGAKLRIVHDGTNVVISAVPVTDYTQDGVSDDQTALTVLKTKNKVNHLICLGTGELADRMVIHLYADAAGNISRTQTFTGLEEYTAVYDYSSVESEDDLVAGGTERFKELLQQDQLDVNFPESDDIYSVGDIVGATDNVTGISIAVPVTKKIVKIEGDLVSVTIETSTTTVSAQASTGTGGGGGGSIGTMDYNQLENRPTLNGKTLEGDVDETDPTVPAWAKNPVKPTYTAADIATADNRSVEAALAEKTNTSVLPNDGNGVKTKFRCAKNGYTGKNNPTRYYALCKFPVSNDGNYASAIVSGRIGGWTYADMSYMHALIWNRDVPGITLIDIAGLNSQINNVWKRCNLVMYVGSDNTATVYIAVSGTYVFDLDIKVFQSTASILYDGTYSTIAPNGTLVVSASTASQRLELHGGKAYMSGNELATTTAAKTATLTVAGWTGSAPYVQSVTITGLTDAKKAMVYPVYGSDTPANIALKEACGMVSFASRSGSTLTFTCLEDKPTVDIPITVEVYV